jgi:hypothetical protein
VIRRVAVAVVLIVGSASPPAQATGWSASTAPAAAGRAAATVLEPVDGGLTATCIVGSLGLSLTIRLSWTDTPQAWVDGYEWRQRVGANSYPASGTSVAVVTPAPHTYTVDVPITAAGTYRFAVRSKAQAWRSGGVESPARTVTKTLGLYDCS